MSTAEVRSSSLVSLENNRNSFCGRWTVRGKVERKSGPVIRYARLGCKRWKCPRCGPKRVRQLRHAITRKATELQLRRFMTLTLDHKTCTPEESLKYIRKCWNKFRTYLKREYGQSITFIAVLEPQKSGHAHLHILVDRYIDQRWISNKWRAVGGGPMVDIRQVDIHRISAYLSKYLTKELLLSSYFDKYRRYTTSRDICLFEKPPKGAWKLFSAPIELVLDEMRCQVLEVGCDESGGLQWFHMRDPCVKGPANGAQNTC